MTSWGHISSDDRNEIQGIGWAEVSSEALLGNGVVPSSHVVGRIQRGL